MHIAAISFRNFKAFKAFTVSLGPFNVLVGPNNAGKSTIVVALRMLAEALRKANAKSPELVRIENRSVYGYRIALAGLPVASENVFHDYDASEPASITFRLNQNKALVLWFPEQGECILRCETTEAVPRSPSQFRRQFPLTVGFVPILGPVESDEPLFQEEAARLALITHRASRNFRNIWHHYPEDFNDFRALVQQTWPGMDILPPETQLEDRKSHLRMFCPEERLPREIYWAGYGFQVWCQMLTFIVKAKGASTLVIDEPDIYQDSCRLPARIIVANHRPMHGVPLGSHHCRRKRNAQIFQSGSRICGRGIQFSCHLLLRMTSCRQLSPVLLAFNSS